MHTGAPRGGVSHIHTGAPQGGVPHTHSGAPQGEVSADAIRLRGQLRAHLLRRWHGHVLMRIWTAQDALAAICPDGLFTLLSHEQRQACLQINTALQPWIHQWISLSATSTHKRLRAFWTSPMAPSEADHCVYVRLNLVNGDMYVGKTSQWATRFFTHFSRVSQHRAGQCTSCKEHAKFTRQSQLRPTQWMTVLVGTGQSEKEAYALEAWLQHRLKPSLNATDKPLWLRRWRETEKADKPSSRRRRTRRPRTHLSQRAATTLTQYVTADGSSWKSVNLLVKAHAADLENLLGPTGFVLQVQPGSADLTDWRRLKRNYQGFCRVDSDAALSLGSWRHERATWGEPFTLYLELSRIEDSQQQSGIWLSLDESEPEASTHLPGDRHDFEGLLMEASDTLLASVWKERHAYERYVRKGGRSQIWTEFQRRYPNLTRCPLRLDVPRPLRIDIALLKSQVRDLLTKHAGWPDFMVEWHIRNLKIVRTSMPSIADALCNMNKPWRPAQRCSCDAFVRQLREQGCGWCPPVTNGHVFFTGREYRGPGTGCLNVASMNIAAPTQWDLQRSWDRILLLLPIPQIPLAERRALLKAQRGATWLTPRSTGWPTTRDVYSTRRVLDGLVVGPLDKNEGELWACCPCLYEDALGALYGERTGYTEVQPRKLTPYQTKKHGAAEVHRYVIGDPEVVGGSAKPRVNQHGQLSDVIRSWRLLYKAKGWSRFGRFEGRGGFNAPYVLFKAKNVTDPAVRALKWAKARPISPSTRHPMRAMLGKAGRAWYFIANTFPGERFALPAVGEVPAFLCQAVKRVQGTEPAAIHVYDIEGCFPSMPKEAIRAALRDITTLHKQLGRKGVFVPRARTRHCQWSKPQRHSGGTWMSFAELVDIMEFALDNAMVHMPDGRLLRQVGGIPMGDPISPGMCIGTGAWMEHEWLKTLSPRDKRRFAGGRYMDDICLVTSGDRRWNRAGFLSDFARSDCYWPPLKLEPCDGGTFLETSYSLEPDGTLRYKLKNVNESAAKVWRYHHFHSHLDYATKRATLLSTLKKVDRMASDTEWRTSSAWAKCSEFIRLGYPPGILRYMCAIVARDSGHAEWLRVRRWIA